MSTENIHPIEKITSLKKKAEFLGHRGGVFGCADYLVLARAHRLFLGKITLKEGINSIILDGDNLRAGLIKI